MVRIDDSNPFFVLSLDGGGAKGVYSLGVLKEIEQLVGKPLYQVFSLIYGTSTGALIASLLALGESVDSIIEKYFEIIPDVMGQWSSKNRSQALIRYANQVFGEKKFDSFLTNVGIITTHYDYRRPMIFKVSKEQAHGRESTFEPGFGCKIADAVIASCSAYPFFSATVVNTTNQGQPKLIDGGFVANNPTLFAIADATKAFQIEPARIKVLSVGVGSYPEKTGWLGWVVRKAWPIQLLDTTFAANTNTIEQIRSILFSDIHTVRIDDAHTDGRYSTNFLESDIKKLRKILDLGRESFGKEESKIKTLLQV